MLSRQVLLRPSRNFTRSIFKVDTVAHMHFGCSHSLKITSTSLRQLKNYRRNVLSSDLQIRYESSTAQQTMEQTKPAVEPIPEPPVPLSDVTESAVEIQTFLNEFNRSTGGVLGTSLKSDDIDFMANSYSSRPGIYKTAMEVFSRPHSGDSSSIVDDFTQEVPETLEMMPEIYKTAVEIWKDETSQRDPVISHLMNASDSEKAEVASESPDLNQQLPQVTGHVNSSVDEHSEQGFKTGYNSIFDSLPEAPIAPSEIDSSVIETLAGEPTFASLGLGSWWPPGMVQNSLEFLHVTCGLPWWASVVCGTLLIRLCLFPVVVLAQRNVAKLNNNLPEMQQIQMRLTDARQRGDSYGAAKYSAELMQFMNEKNMNPLKNMIPPLVQAPVFISVFMGLRGMAYLPVESLKTGGMLWFTDLTTPDQFYILPIVTSATLYFTIKLGADSGQTTQNMVLMKYFLTAIPVIMVPFTINFPGLLLVYWTTTNFISLAQVGFLRIPGVREYCKIEKLIKHQSNTMPIKDKGFINNVKDAWTNLKITSELEQRSHADKMAFMQAGRDPIKKTYKYDPTKIRPSATAIQAKTK